MQSVWRSTFAIIFLGTPHRGSGVVNLGSIASRAAHLIALDTDDRIIESLSHDNELLDNIHAEFMKMIHTGDFQIHSFQEGRALSGTKPLNSKV